VKIYNFNRKMKLEGYVEYKRREFCNDVKCPVQMEMNLKKEGSEEYEKLREICKTNCKFSAREFHYWLMKKGYLIVRPEVK